MQLIDLISLCREESDDKAAGYLWTDAYLTILANEAQIEACRRARLLRSPATHTVALGDRSINLGDKIIFVRQCKLASKTLPLVRKHMKDLDLMLPGWDTGATDGSDILYFCPDKETNTLWFSAPFPGSDTVQLSVIRTPTSDMRAQVLVGTVTTTTAIDPEISNRYQYGLVNYMLYRAFSKQDSETNDPEKAKKALDAFEAEFGKKSSAQDEMYSQEQYGFDDFDGSY